MQIIVDSSKILTFVYLLAELSMFLFKAYKLTYTSPQIIGEVIGLFIYLFLNLIRLKFMSVGNKVEYPLMLTIGLILMIPIVIIHIYYIRLQIYVLIFEIILNIACFLVLGAEIIFGIFTLVNISAYDKSSSM